MRTQKLGWLLLAGGLLSLPGQAQVTTRVSVDSSGVQANWSCWDSSISADGRYVAFDSQAFNLVPGDTNGAADVFVRDRITGMTERVSVDSAGLQGNNHSAGPRISADGRYVAFTSYATNLVPGDNNDCSDIFVHDRSTGTTERVSVDSAGLQGNLRSLEAWISADGRYVGFSSEATNLVASDTNGCWDVFVHDRQSGTTERMSVNSAGIEGDSESSTTRISTDGRYVAFMSAATNLVSGDTNGAPDVFIRDRQLGTTELVSVAASGSPGNLESDVASMSADGRYVAFYSIASDLVTGDTNGTWDVFVRDRQAATTERASVGAAGLQGDGASYPAAISDDGRYVAFQSNATSLVSSDTNGYADVFVRDRGTGTTERVSVNSAGQQASLGSWLSSLSSDGRFVTFFSSSSDLVPGDTNQFEDVFLRDRNAAGFTSLCDPGSAGVIACPCGNPPAGAGRGCENSSTTGGASLSATGIAYLSSDSLVFTTDGETPSATSLLLQGTAELANGQIFGQGVRCVGGVLKRMYLTTAVGGSISVPDSSAGDPSVSARSTFLGDTIQPGEARYYLVYYRDPLVQGGCPATSAFNSTQTASISWWP